MISVWFDIVMVKGNDDFKIPFYIFYHRSVAQPGVETACGIQYRERQFATSLDLNTNDDRLKKQKKTR